MAELNLDKKQLDESYGVLKKMANDSVLECIENLAQVLLPQAGTNDAVDNVIAQCKKAQEFYNEAYLPVVKSVLNDFEQLSIISEYYKNGADIDEISVGSIDYKKSGIDATEVM